MSTTETKRRRRGMLDRLIEALACGIGDFFYFVVRFRRPLVESNLRLAFPEKQQSARNFIARENYRHYVRSFLEAVRGIFWNADDFRKHCRFEGLEHFRAATANGQGAIFLTSHLGNWEIGPPSGPAFGLPLSVVVKRTRSERLDALLRRHRERTGGKVLWESGTALAILRDLRHGRTVAFVLDQFMGPPIGLPVRFFGHTAGTAAALALFLEKRDFPVLPAYSYRDADGTFVTVIEAPLQFSGLSDDLGTRLAQRTQTFNDVLEAHVRRHPSQWLWLHRRWKNFVGEPRWKPAAPLAPTFAAALFTLGLAGCASFMGGAGTTGIELPPEPTISAPVIQEVKDEKLETVAFEAGPQGAAPGKAPEVVETAPAPGEKKSKKKASGATSSKGGPTVIRVVNPEKIPFEIGEQQEIDMTWMALSAGRAVVEVREGPVMNGRPTFHFWANARSSKLVDSIYKVDNTIESYADRSALLPYKFLLHMVESAQLKETRVVFDHPKKKAFYWAKRISEKWGNQDTDRTDDMETLARDAFTALFAARTAEFKKGQKVRIPVYENGKNLVAEITPLNTEVVRTKAGVFQCWKLSLNILLNNVFKPMGDINVWLSDDSKRYVVKFEAKLKIGALTGSLVSVRDHQ